METLDTNLHQRQARLGARCFVALTFLLWSLLIATSCSNDDCDSSPSPQYATLKEALQHIESITKISENPDTSAMKRKEELNYKEQYSMFFLQDLNHDDEGGDTFLQKVCILFRGFDRPTVFVTEGYDWVGFEDISDLAVNLNANVVHVEHRNYGESYNQDNGTWKYQTFAQASADLHAVYQALKPLFKERWMSAGTSKNGETSISYSYYYPQDMNLAAAFCSPFIVGLNDERFGNYLFNEVSTEENRNLMKQAIRKALIDGENGLYKEVCKQIAASGQQAPVFNEYIFNLFDTCFQIFQYVPNDEDRKKKLQAMVADNETLVKEIWVTIEGNRDQTVYSYWVECAKEMGWPNNGYSYFADLLEGTSFNLSEMLPDMLKPQDRYLVTTYDGKLYENLVNNFFMTSTCPLLLYYVHDDPWTAGIPSKVGPNTKTIINPIGKHNSALNDPSLCPEDIKQEVMSYVLKYI